MCCRFRRASCSKRKNRAAKRIWTCMHGCLNANVPAGGSHPRKYKNTCSIMSITLLNTNSKVDLRKKSSDLPQDIPITTDISHLVMNVGTVITKEMSPPLHQDTDTKASSDTLLRWPFTWPVDERHCARNAASTRGGTPPEGTQDFQLGPWMPRGDHDVTTTQPRVLSGPAGHSRRRRWVRRHRTLRAVSSSLPPWIRCGAAAFCWATRSPPAL